VKGRWALRTHHNALDSHTDIASNMLQRKWNIPEINEVLTRGKVMENYCITCSLECCLGVVSSKDHHRIVPSKAE